MDKKRAGCTHSTHSTIAHLSRPRVSLECLVNVRSRCIDKGETFLGKRASPLFHGSNVSDLEYVRHGHGTILFSFLLFEKRSWKERS